MKVVQNFSCKETLSKVKPSSLKMQVTAAEHAARFYALESCDVWTADSWLVTSVFGAGDMFSHQRKGNEIRIVEFDGSEMLFFNPTPAAEYKLSEFPLETPQQ